MMAPLKRCALYTRKSSEEGLQQDFNSLDAQREACAAYVTSQAGEGWRALPALYDDGGFSGGTMERPALQRLLADIKMGKVDVVVVYKIDRLTRALADFARIVELFDQHSVSFVSVTQSFNTTSSMGRLTLNVLLSFAQFEREVTGERIRDKIAASKAKGMWMGGVLPLGFDLPVAGSHALVVNPDEAETVRTIFATYLEIGSVHALATRLQQIGIRSKQWITAKGHSRGGKPFSRGALFHLLRNRTYLGLIVHGDKAHPGMHPPILDTQTFEAVQTRLNANTRRRREQTDHKTRSTLTGRIFDADGHPMSPTMARNRHGKIYRYYVSAPLQQGRQQDDDDTTRRVSARAIEERLTELLNRLKISKGPNSLDTLLRVDVHQQTLNILLDAKHLRTIRPRLAEHDHVEIDPDDASRLRLTVPTGWCKRGGRSELIETTDRENRPDKVLVSALRTAHAMVHTDPDGLPRVDNGPASPYRRKLIRLAFLSPNLQRAILAGSQPASLTLAKLMASDIPLSWAEQE